MAGILPWWLVVKEGHKIEKEELPTKKRYHCTSCPIGCNIESLNPEYCAVFWFRVIKRNPNAMYSSGEERSQKCDWKEVQDFKDGAGI